jgi:glycosyltransferase involved in cell wall biosynthesis
MAKKKLIFDIAIFAFSADLSGVPRFTLEILKRLMKRNDLEIVLICSLENEAEAFFNLKQNLDFNSSFQTRERKEAILSDSDEFLKQKLIAEKKYPTFLGRVKDFVLSYFPKSKLLYQLIDLARKIKKPILQSFLFNKNNLQTETKFRYFEQLVIESDIYFSPFYPLLPELSANPSIRKAIVIHDLIPFVHPELLVNNDLYFMLRKIANHITPDLFIFTVSENSKRDIEHFFPPIEPDKLIDLPEGASPHFNFCDDKTKIFPVLKKYNIPTDCRYITSVAAQDDRKNFATIIYAFERLCQKYSDKFTDLRLVLTGSKTCNSTVKIQKAVDSLNNDCKKRFIFTGYVDETDLPFIYNGASCFCFMSLYEGFGLPPLEAMQCGVPVITSNTSSLPEVVGDAGIMLDPHDVDGLVNAFYRVLTDENLRNEMITKGFEQSKKFNWDRCVDLIIEKLIN